MSDTNLMGFKSQKTGIGPLYNSGLSPEQQPMNTQNYVSIMKRKDMESNILNEQFNFEPKRIGGKIGTLLDM